MLFRTEGGVAAEGADDDLIRKEIQALNPRGPSSFAALMHPEGGFLQTAGGGPGCLLEHHPASGEHFKAYQATPQVPFPDGMLLVFTQRDVPMRRDEWFTVSQVQEIFIAYAKGEDLPEYVFWRPFQP